MMDPFSLEGRLIVMTGTPSGIGRQCMIDCGKMGASVALIAQDEEWLKETVSMTEYPERHSRYLMDLFQTDRIRPSVDNIASTHDKINAYVHAVGIEKTLPLKLLSSDDYRSVFTVNTLSAFEFIRYFSSRKNSSDGGRIVLALSILSIVERGEVSAYAASEGVMVSAVKSVTLEFIPKKICTNSISPGTIRTPLVEHFLSFLSEEDYKRCVNEFPLGLGEVTDISRTCLFLLSDASRQITGQSTIVDGGYMAQQDEIMEVLVKKTLELSDEEIVVIYVLLEGVFGQKRDVTTLRENCSSIPLGYPYHSMLLNEEENTVGFHSCIPFYYQGDDERFMVALGIGSMVKKAYRDYFNFHDMIVQCQKRLKEDGCVPRIGFPNDNSYPILKKGLKYRDVGKLITYYMVHNIGAVKRRFAFLNIFSRIFSRAQYACSFLSIGHRPYSFKYHKEREPFNKVCYRWFGDDYQKMSYRGPQFIYKLERYSEVETVFLLEVWPSSKSAFEGVARYIYRREWKGIDMIIYAGNLLLTPVGLLSVPHHSEPKHFNFTCKPLVRDSFDGSLYGIRNREVNLSDYDLP